MPGAGMDVEKPSGQMILTRGRVVRPSGIEEGKMNVSVATSETMEVMVGSGVESGGHGSVERKA